jgi:glycerol-3-phosphate dehydrogenase
MNRETMLKNIGESEKEWDIIVIGGGATGVGVAVDAASRGYSVCLLERYDFGKGASSRSTKLVHGGVRYLQQGNITLVIESLHERGILRQNAPHLVSELPFVIPDYALWELPFYGVGMKVYDVLAGRYGFPASEILSKEDVISHIPNLQQEGLVGGTLYYDGQFDDSRLLINLARTAVDQGATVLNYMNVTGLTYDDKKIINGVTCSDTETNKEYTLHAKCVVNATGPFTDALRLKDDNKTKPIMSPSQGVHIILPREFLPGDTAIMVPHTSDGRVMFAIPWRGQMLVGTTDRSVDTVEVNPIALDTEVDFILETAAPYLTKKPTRADVKSVFAGIRPLARESHEKDTASLSRDLVIDISTSGLLTITGGKWTTYRKMAEDCVNHAIILANLEDRPCVTKKLNIHGHYYNSEQLGDLHYYGIDALSIREIIQSNPDYGKKIHESLIETVAEVIWVVRHEMVQTLDDVLSRRLRITFMDAKRAIEVAPYVADIMAKELGKDEGWKNWQVEEFIKIAEGFVVK